VSDNILANWPHEASAVVFRLDAGRLDVVAQSGDLEVVRPWASVTKMAVAFAAAIEVTWELHRFEESVLGPTVTMANLLSHSSGLGLEPGDPGASPSTKRIYSNDGYDQLVAWLCGENPAAEWLADRIFTPLGMSSCQLVGRAAAGLEGSTTDMLRLATAWLRPDALEIGVRNRVIKPYMPDLAGVVPGFGRFEPCPWGLGPEVRGAKSHWMGEWPADSFGHFGQSGALMLLNATEQIGLVATSTQPFGEWAHDLWPQWTTEMLALARRGS
jgi:CubicO group peptidase (beta-lactamase class C family)